MQQRCFPPRTEVRGLQHRLFRRRGMQTFLGSCLSIVLALVVLLWVVDLVTPTRQETPQARAFHDMRNCERRAGVLPPTEPGYPESRRARYADYVWCMTGLGYTTATLP